jgi:hypothetical protein
MSTTPIPSSRRRRRTFALHFRSRSQITSFGACPAVPSAIVSVRTTCCMNSASGCGVDPRICTRREAKSIAKTVSYVTKPRQVHTSAAKKSAPAIAPQCERERLPRGGQCGTGGSPAAVRIRRMVERPTRCQRQRARPGFSCSPTSDCPLPSARWVHGSRAERCAVRVSRRTSNSGQSTGDATAARVSGVAIVAIPRRTARPTRNARAASRRRSPSVRRSRRPPI